MPFPAHRPRRLRRTEALRRVVRETSLAPEDFIYPLFIKEGVSGKVPVSSMPGIHQLSVEGAVDEAREAAKVGVPAVIVFGVPTQKDAQGTGAYSAGGIALRAMTAIKKALPEMLVVADVCLCEYTDHGHCGVLTKNGDVDNDATLPLLAKAGVAAAQAGADIIAPSDMMDGRIQAMRTALDGAGFSDIPLLSYAAKYASGFYGPFREAAQSAPQKGDRRGYQMDPGNAREALREVALDLEEGADMVMVKPALSYLDIIRTVKDRWDVPVVAYNVSGEYAMVKAAAQNNWIDGDRVMMEVLTSIKRAGADLIISYHAIEAAKLLRGHSSP